MPEFAIVSLQEAKLKTIPDRQGRFLNEYVADIHQLSPGQAGKLSSVERESPATIRRRLHAAAVALGTKLITKRSGENVYFWREDKGDEQRYTRRNRRGRAGDYFPPQPFIEPELTEQGIPKEESPELGQLAAEAERRMEQS